MGHMKYIVNLIILLLLAGCDVNESEDGVIWPPFDQNTQPEQYGLLLDSAVEGLRYISGTHYGITNSEGVFGYMPGEKIQFYIGNIKLGYSISPTNRITPYELANGNSSVALNIARLLQTIDHDSNLENGIQISDAAHLIAKDIDITFNDSLWPDSPNLETNFPEVLNAIYILTSVTEDGERGLVGKYDAYYHYSTTLDALIDDATSVINEIASQSSCATNEQCRVDELNTKYLYYCPPPGPLIVYSENDIDKAHYDSLVLERNYLIGIKQVTKSNAVDDNTTGYCQSFTPSYTLICNNQSRCEIQY